ncbi:DUF1800 domain-containing protein [Rubrivirga sp.]|uniref:DUF1800 domain-containing protein n=1 Tax=Rubrivirga sp. TaxID=1885344 RepID=UPI003C792A5C
MNRRAFLTRSQPVLRHTTARADLTPYTGPWTADRAAHLVRRTHFGASRPDVVGALVAGSPDRAVGAMIEDATSRPLPDRPRWANSTTGNGGDNIQRLYEWQRAWYAEMADGGLREKMTLFWHDHFATGQAVYYHAAFSVEYLTFLRERAIGPFRPLLEGIGERPAMLRFLDNDQNQAGNINENYAREILELFSMGITGPDGSPNYTQQDVIEAARALTGWTVDEGRIRGRFEAGRHDGGNKTLFGQTGAWDADDVVDLIFSQRGDAVAHFLSGKLYAWFVHPVPNAGVVQALAGVLRQTDFDLEAALRALLTSAHFYDSAVVGARLKTPMELLIGLTRELGLTPSQDALERFRVASQSIGQEVLNPPSVEGWPGYDDPLEYRAWVTTGTISERRGLADDAVFGSDVFPTYDPLPLVEQVSDRFDPYRMTHDLAAHLLAIPLSDLDADDLAERTVLDGVPTSYTREERQGFWTEIIVSSESAARDRLRQLLSALVNLPEYQLV